MPTKVKHITTSTNLLFDRDETIRFSGTNDTLGFAYLAGSDTVIADGHNQTISFARSSNNTIIDRGHGLTLMFSAPVSNEVVKGLQNDIAGRVGFSVPVTYASDHHGGIMATGSGLSVDFEGFKSIAALEARVRPIT